MAIAFGERIRELRLRRRLGLREAAAQAGIDHSLWNRFETGKRRPPNPANKPKEAEKIIASMARVLRTEEHDPLPELLALATLPDDTSPEVIQPLTKHYARRLSMKLGGK